MPAFPPVFPPVTLRHPARYFEAEHAPKENLVCAVKLHVFFINELLQPCA